MTVHKMGMKCYVKRNVNSIKKACTDVSKTALVSSVAQETSGEGSTLNLIKQPATVPCVSKVESALTKTAK